YYMTRERPFAKGEGMIFSSPTEVSFAYATEAVHLQAKIKCRVHGKIYETTVGRALLSEIIPSVIPFSVYNKVLDKKSLAELIDICFRLAGTKSTVILADQLMSTGFKMAMRAGISICLEDMIIPQEKQEYLEKAYAQVKEIEDQYVDGLITDGERYNKVIDIWAQTSELISAAMMKKLSTQKIRSPKGEEITTPAFNGIFMMADSGARGSNAQIRQLAGMRGLMAKPSGEIIETPITAHFREGLSVLQYFISTHGARKGLADTALKTADAGYLTRRLVDVAQDVIITQVDCGTIRGIQVKALKDVEEEREPLAERISGRVAQEEIIDPRTNEVIVEQGQMITDEMAEKIEDANIDTVYIRTVLTCEARRGVCAKCYGRNLTTGKLVEVGEAVGIIAAQSIGEPGTQLTLRTFHLGGTSSRIASQSQLESNVEGYVKFEKIQFVEKKVKNPFGGPDAVSKIVTGRRGIIEIYDENHRQIKKYDVPYGAELLVNEGDFIKKKQPLFNHDPYNSVVLSDVGGIVKYVDLVEGVTLQQVTDEQTLHVQKVVIESKDKTLTPSILIQTPNGDLKTFNLPVRSFINVDEGEEIPAGTVLAKIPKQTAKSRDITGGLPRVTELFEARSPHDPAIVSEIEGIVKFGVRKKGTREIIVTAPDGSDEKRYSVPLQKHILVQDGDEISAGEKITDGPVNPHDILAIKGTNAVQEYLVNEIQEVYRLQGVKINDKHIEVIVRQMLQKVKVVSSGDTKLLEEELVDKAKFAEENERIANMYYVVDKGDSKLKNGQLVPKFKIREINAELKRKGKKEVVIRETEPATFENVLLGITTAALSTESWLSAASFQETTKVLANAAVEAKTDYLNGLKENIVMGQLIPAGTGLKKYRNIILEETTQPEVIEKKDVS
ncbi:MAG: DNA-directed RNA polymerase subunit beta', partial [Ignavibacterium sp.]|nr:DNA-directed RNA polymerase subunit beta' [Ignavibacterium sp.]